MFIVTRAAHFPSPLQHKLEEVAEVLELCTDDCSSVQKIMVAKLSSKPPQPAEPIKSWGVEQC